MIHVKPYAVYGNGLQKAVASALSHKYTRTIQ